MSGLVAVLAIVLGCVAGEPDMGEHIYRPGDPLEAADIDSIVDSLLYRIIGGKGVRVRSFGNRLIVERDAKRRAAKELTGPPLQDVVALVQGYTAQYLVAAVFHYDHEVDPVRGMYISNNYGKTWRRVWTSADDGLASGSGFASSGDGLVLTTEVNGVGLYVSVDRGSTWELSLPSSSVDVRETTINSDGSYIFVFGEGVGPNADDVEVWLSTDYGDSWDKLHSWDGTSGSLVGGLGCSQTGQYVLVADWWTDDVRVSTNYGTALPVIFTSSFNPYTAGVSPSGQYMYVSGSLGRLYVSNDYGSSWTQRSPFSDLTGTSISHGIPWIDDNGNILTSLRIGGGTDPGAYMRYSTDEGASWDDLYPYTESEYDDVDYQGAYPFAVDAATFTKIFTSLPYGDSRCRYSANRGSTWADRGIILE